MKRTKLKTHWSVSRYCLALGPLAPTDDVDPVPFFSLHASSVAKTVCQSTALFQNKISL